MPKFSDMVYGEVMNYLKERQDILLPLGAVEEHGYHLPLSTDGDIALAVVEELERELEIAVAPVIWYGVCVSTAQYPGTISVSFDGLRYYVRDILRELQKDGFKIIYLLSGHLGSSQKAALREAWRDLKDGPKTYLLDMSAVDVSSIVETPPMHACETETSLMLHLYPDKVDMARAVDEEVTFKKFSMAESLKPTDSGTFGYPTKASAEKGEKIFKKVVEEFSDFIASRA